MAKQNPRTKTTLTLILIFALALSVWMTFTPDSDRAMAQSNSRPDVDELRSGKNFIPTMVYSDQEDQAILKRFEGLRVADVSDGMDKVGLADVGLMSHEIHAAWKDTTEYTHRFIGIAVTVRYVPTNDPPAPAMETEAFDKWVGKTYSEITPEPFVPLIRKGTALVIDDAQDSDVGTIGSNNIMGWKCAAWSGWSPTPVPAIQTRLPPSRYRSISGTSVEASAPDATRSNPSTARSSAAASSSDPVTSSLPMVMV